MHLLITDSGLGGLSVCAATERALRLAAAGPVRITYFNAWPEEVSGYNDMSDIESRAMVFDRALSAMGALTPDCIVIACNTLSIVYEHTRFRHAATVPVVGIVETGVDLFAEALTAAPGGSIVLLGTRTTIESGAHRARLIERGIAPERIAAVPCHGLARAIEMDPEGGTVANLIEQCMEAASCSTPAGSPLHLGICCTHYTYVRDQMGEALQRHCGRPVQALDPNDRLAVGIARRIVAAGAKDGAPEAAEEAANGAALAEMKSGAEITDRGTGLQPCEPRVVVVSKVTMDERRRQSIARRVRKVSPATAEALLSYTRVPDLF